MVLATLLLFVVFPERVLSSDTYSSFVDFHSNVCPPCLLGVSESSLKNPCCSVCDCGLPACKQYGTCCLGVLGSFDAAYESVSQTLYTCVDPSVYAYTKSAHSPRRGQLMISHCIISTPDPIIQDLCENPDVDKGLETLIPVIDLSTSIYFRNQYCVLCSDQTSFDKIQRWDMKIDCENDVSYTYENMHQMFKEQTCNVSFVPPHSRSCVPYEISTCNVTGQWKVYNETLERACHSLVDPFNQTYKNVFCFLCNVDTSVSRDLTQCQSYNETVNTGSVSFVNVPFLAMLDLSAVAMTESSLDLQCNKDLQFKDEKLGVCRDIFCDDTQYLYFDGSCALKPQYDDPRCYMISIKVTSLTGDYLSIHFVEDMTNSMNYGDSDGNRSFTDTEVYIKEAESGNNLVEYFIFNGISDNATFAWETFSFLDKQSSDVVTSLNVLLQFVAYNIPYFNGQVIPEIPGIDFETNHDELVQWVPASGPTNCINKTTVYLNKLMQCPFIKLKLGEISMNITSRYLYFLDINTTALYWLKYKRVNDNVFICLSDYKLVYEKLPEFTKRNIEIPKFLNEVSLKNFLSLICICISIGCLLVTMVILTITPDFHTQPGLNTLVLCVCLLVAQTVYQFGVGQANLSSWLCAMIGAVSHLLWLCVMFAMNVCSLDMFLIFRKLQMTRFDSPLRKTLQRVVYILTLSIFFLAINILVSLINSEGADVGYGGAICYISSRSMQILTFIVPSVLTIMINIALYIVVVFKISKISIRTAGLNHERNYFGIYARLSSLTGFTWIVGFVLLLIKNEVLEYVFILLNASQGLFIMIAFILNRRLFNQCCERLSTLRSDTRSTRISKQ